MSKKTIPKQQHYVPRFLLKGFATGKHDQLWVFDKQTERVFRTAIKNVAVQNAFYDLPVEDGLLTLEPGLSELEAQVAPLFKRIRRERSIAFLTDDQRGVIALFLASQRVRTQHWRNDFLQASTKANEKARQIAAQLGVETAAYPDLSSEPISHEVIKRAALQTIQAAHKLAPILLDKSWVLFANDGVTPFLLADNPVALQNLQNRDSPYGNLGYLSIGIEIYLPLTPDLILGLLCPSYEEQVFSIGQAAALTSAIGALVPPEVQHRVTRVEEIARGMTDGSPVASEPDNVLNLNVLQVRYAERYVYSVNDDFALVTDLLHRYPRYRTGPRIEVY